MTITVTNTSNTSKEGQHSKEITLEPSALQSMNIWWIQNLRILSYLASEFDFMINSGTELHSLQLDCRAINSACVPYWIHDLISLILRIILEQEIEETENFFFFFFSFVSFWSFLWKGGDIAETETFCEISEFCWEY